MDSSIRKWHKRHARARLAAATGNWDDIDRLTAELEREASRKMGVGPGENQVDGVDGGLGVDSTGDEGGG